MLYRAPVAYQVARSIRSGGLVLSAGQILSDDALAGIDVESLLGSRHIRPIISPSARRSSGVVIPMPESEDPAAPAVAPAASEVKEETGRHTVAQILEFVGDDPVTAAAWLEAEQESDKPRSTLVSALMATIKAGQDSPA